jgi:hypothetical protein
MDTRAGKKPRMKFAIAGLMLAIIVGCASNGPTLGPITSIQVLGVEARGSDGSACQGFAFTVNDARRYFGRAVIATPYDINYGYDILGCTAHGTGISRGRPLTWEVDRGGTGTVTVSQEFTFAVADSRQRAKPQ